MSEDMQAVQNAIEELAKQLEEEQASHRETLKLTVMLSTRLSETQDQVLRLATLANTHCERLDAHNAKLRSLSNEVAAERLERRSAMSIRGTGGAR